MRLWFSRIVSLVTLYSLARECVRDAKTAFDPDISFSASLVDGVTVEVASCCAMLLPLVAFLVYFSYWGQLGWQLRAAVAALVISGLTCLVYLVAALSVRYPPPLDDLDVGLVVAAASTFVFWAALAIGVQFRWATLQRPPW
jgi:hypothetical protein